MKFNTFEFNAIKEQDKGSQIFTFDNQFMNHEAHGIQTVPIYDLTIAEIHRRYLNSIIDLPNWKKVFDRSAIGVKSFRAHLLALAPIVGKNNTLSVRKWPSRNYSEGRQTVINQEINKASDDWKDAYHKSLKELYDHEFKPIAGPDILAKKPNKQRNKSFNDVVETIKTYKTLKNAFNENHISSTMYSKHRLPIGAVKLVLKRKDVYGQFSEDLKNFTCKGIEENKISSERIKGICKALNAEDILEKPVAPFQPWEMGFSEILESILETRTIGEAANNIGIISRSTLHNYLRHLQLLILYTAAKNKLEISIPCISYKNIARTKVTSSIEHLPNNINLLVLFYKVGLNFFTPIYTNQAAYDISTKALRSNSNDIPIDTDFTYQPINPPITSLVNSQWTMIHSLLGKRLNQDELPSGEKFFKKDCQKNPFKMNDGIDDTIHTKDITLTNIQKPFDPDTTPLASSNFSPCFFHAPIVSAGMIPRSMHSSPLGAHQFKRNETVDRGDRLVRHSQMSFPACQPMMMTQKKSESNLALPQMQDPAIFDFTLLDPTQNIPHIDKETEEAIDYLLNITGSSSFK